MRCIEAFIKFIAPDSQEPPVFAMLVIVFTGGLYLRAIQNYMGPTVTFEEAKLQVVQHAKVEESED